MKDFDVVGVGYTNVDFLGTVARYPALDEKAQILDFAKQGGGVTATAMAAVARLGGRARYIGKVGGDDFGSYMLAELEREGVDTTRVVAEQGVNSQFSFVVVDQATGKRTILWTNAGLKLLPEELRREDIVSGKVLLVDAHFAQAATLAASWANEEGIPVVMDAGSVREGHEELMLHVDYLITSETFARAYTGMDDPREAAQSMFTGRRVLSAVTLNERGCVWVTKDGIFHEPAFSVEAVDTTGAGDVFHGAFAYALALGWQIEQCIRFASAVAAMKCTKLGGRAGIPTKQETLNFMMDQGKSV